MSNNRNMKEATISKTIKNETVSFHCYQDEFDNIGLSYVNEDDYERFGQPWQYFERNEIETKVFSPFPF